MVDYAARLLPLSALFLLVHSADLGAQPQPARPPLLHLGDAVVRGFSGTVALDPTKPLGRRGICSPRELRTRIGATRRSECRRVSGTRVCV